MGSVMRARKKPVCISFVTWTGGNLREVIDFTGLHPSAEKWTWDEYEKIVAADGLKIFTLEGAHLASVGDVIIRGVQGEHYPCKPDIFAETYEVVGPAEESGEQADNTGIPKLPTAAEICAHNGVSVDSNYGCIVKEVLDAVRQLRADA